MAQREAGFEIVPVTADKGIRAWGPDPEAVFRQAALALWSLMVDPAAVARGHMLHAAVEAGDREALLVAWLNELLYLYETQGFIGCECAVTSLGETQVEAELWGETVNPRRHTVLSHVKAVTYHQLHVSQTPGGWEGRAVVDV